MISHHLVRKKESEGTQSCPTICDPMDCSLPCFSEHGIFPARVLEWVAISFSRVSSQPRNWTQVSHIVGRCFTHWVKKQKHGSNIRSVCNIYWILALWSEFCLPCMIILFNSDLYFTNTEPFIPKNSNMFPLKWHFQYHAMEVKSLRLRNRNT